MKTLPHIVGVAGSLRAGSSNEVLLRAALGGRDAIAFSVFSDIGALPHFSPDADGDAIVAVSRWRAVLAGADGAAFAVPEYAHGIPGFFKNALDWLVSTMVLNQKPILLFCGGPYVKDHLVEVLKTMDTVPQALVVRGRHAVDAAGGVGADVEAAVDTWLAAVASRRA